MSLKAGLISLFARKVTRTLRQTAKQALLYQEKTLLRLIRKGGKTQFGTDHNFEHLRDYRSFKEAIPIRTYEEFRPYIDRVVVGEEDVLWPGRPLYFAKTSGTTSGVKNIPMTHDSTPHHVETARNSVLNYITESGSNDFMDGKMVYLSGSPEMKDTNGIKTGRLSGIVNHQIPSWLQGNKLPSYQVNCIDDWEKKVAAIVEESSPLDVRLIGGIPPWVQMYYEALLDYTGKSTVKEIFPNLSLFVYGGVNYEPYRSKLEQLVGDSVDSIETFPASEGFFAFQDKPIHEGLLLNVNAGIFYEFVPLESIHDEEPTRLKLSEVETGVNYAMIVTSNAGLWAYNMGDTVEFVSLDPPRLIVTGRIKHFISAFGEHVIGKEVEQAMLAVSEKMHFQIVEFTVAPQVSPPMGLPYHEWFIEFAKAPEDLNQIELELDHSLQEQNIYYKDLIEGSVLRRAKITPIQRHGFRSYMESIGKLGGQNKLPRLSNDRKIADKLFQYKYS